MTRPPILHRARRYAAGAAAGLLLALAPGCRDEAPASSQTLDDPWLPGNGAFDERSCEDCEPFAELHDPHLRDLDLRLAPDLDDPLAQWGECIGSVFACWEDDDEPLPTCVAASSCPEPCKAEFRREVEGAADVEEEVYAFNRVFVDDDAPCRQPEPADPEVAP